MKKIVATFAILTALYSCKKESNETQPATLQATPPEQVQQSQSGDVVTPVSPVLNPDAIVPPDFYETNGTYDGVGIVSNRGEMDYNILMPELKTGSYSFVAFYNLGNNVLFMQMQDPDFQPLNVNSIYTLRENILPLGFNFSEDVSVFLYFENGAILTKTQAQRVYAKGCKNLSEPKKCGIGILRIADR